MIRVYCAIAPPLYMMTGEWKPHKSSPLAPAGHLLVSQLANMTRLLLLSMVASGLMAMSTKESIRRDMEKFNNDAMCWGVENMMAYRLAQYKAMEECGKYGQFSTLPAPANNPFTTLPGDASNPWMNVPQPVDSRRNPLSKLFNRNSNSDKWTNLWSDFLNGRSKRQAEEGLLEIDEAAELEQFLEDYDEFKEDIGSMIGNLTCVLTKMDMLDSALQVNLKLWTTDIWQQLNLKKTLAGEDPEWRQKLIGGYTDCYQIASNWPQQSLDRNPITKVFGRHMIFFKCAMVSWDARKRNMSCYNFPPPETRQENVRDGSDALLAHHPLWQQR